MRRKRSPERTDWPHWRRARPGWRVAGAFLASATLLHAQADKGLVSDRAERVQRGQEVQQVEQKASTEVWTPAKIVINLDARCPVITALGYFGAFAAGNPDPAKAAELQSRYAQLQKMAAPLAEELKQMAVHNAFVGQKFPETLMPRLNAMCGELYGTVLKLYGDDGLKELKEYVATYAQGAFVR